jgi:pimeloyl-ACP methyl ester carboxylesterase
MTSNRRLSMAVFAFAALIAVPALSLAQSHPEYVALGRLSAALYRPDAGPAPHVAFVIMHRTANYLHHIGCTELSKRGFLVLCMNTRFQNNEAQVRWEQTPLDVKAGVEYLRGQPGITKVVLFGHSGGGPLMSFYQAVAEKGPGYCQGAQKLVRCADDLTGVPRADAIVFADAHPGNPVQVLRALNPSVVSEGGKLRVIPELDPFDPKNGFNPRGRSQYSKAFQDRYYMAQAQRMSEKIAAASAAEARMKKGDYPFPDDDIVIIPAGGNPGAGAGGDATLTGLDPGIPDLMTTSKPQKLLKNDGTVATQIVTSVAVADPDLARANRAFDTGTKIFTIKSFLSANAVRVTDARDGIDHCSTNNSTTCAVQSISVPILIAAMGGYRFIRDDEVIFEKAASRDKDYVVIEGALHGFTPCAACERTPGQYSNTVRNFFDYIQQWTNARF